ncbi:MAG TPA: HAMP domain-containing sensor histidine kinase [Synergistales bacterium]|jgi:signal transduction histidine kinase|nr:HAMP domain-containing sensor histidine kinase [Synergistales bacterium]HRV70911.1 HAMP domain-containing sensor histidine kinase [Thermovirgaceae bacterium]
MKRTLSPFSIKLLSSQLNWGSLLLVIWIVSQFYEKPIYHVFRLLELAVRFDDSGYLIAATTVLVVVNAARALLLYEGWFLIGNGISETSGKPMVDRVIPLVGIPLCYQAVALFDFPSIPHFGMPAILGLASVLIVQYLTRSVTRWLNRAIALVLLLVSFQWLDVIPALTKYGFGWGELSMAIKNIAELPDKGLVLDIVGIIFFLCLFLGSLLTIELLVSYERQLDQFRKFRKQERELSSLREQQLESRAVREIQHLVHDLKRPLTTIIGLADVMIEKGGTRTSQHASVILKSSRSMDQMISEILDAGSGRRISLCDLVNYSLSQTSPMDWSKHIEVDISPDCGKTSLHVNVIRFSRALANLLDNAAKATEGTDSPKILLSASATPLKATISVEDNGPGFRRPPRPHRSGWGSTGLGLVFVEEVVKDHGGKISFGKSALGGAWVKIFLPMANGLEDVKKGGRK